MKKRILTYVCLTVLLLGGTVMAQNNKSSDTFTPSWYMGANGGVNWFLGEGNDFLNDGGIFPIKFPPGYLGRLEVGYHFNPVYAVRGFVGYDFFNQFYRNSLTSPILNKKFSSEFLIGDVLMNFTNMAKGYNPKRVFNFSGFAGLGGGYLNQNTVKTKIGGLFHLGLQYDFNITPQLAINLITEGKFLTDNTNDRSGGLFTDVVPAATLGLAYRFRAPQESAPVVDEKIPVVEKPVEEPVVEPEEPVVEPEEPVVEPEVEETPEVESAVDYLNEHFYFAINNADVKNEEYAESLNVISQYVKAHPDAQIIIRGYADQGTGNVDLNNRISKERAVNIANTLIRQYDVPYKNIWVRWYGGGVQPYIKDAKNNRLVIVHTSDVKQLIPARTATDFKKKVNEATDSSRPAINVVEEKVQEIIVGSEKFPLTRVIYFNEKALSPRDAVEEEKVKLVADYLNSHPQATVSLDGYADTATDSEAKSTDISRQRTQNIANMLINKYNISKDRVTANWYGARSNAALNKMVLIKITD